MASQGPVDPRPIGIFDSGLGGLTVLRSLATRFPQETFLYLGDVARLPYGNKSPETIRKYGEQILHFLIQRNVKMLIIACNTASSVFLGDESFAGLPLYNVIHPGARGASAVTKNKRIGVIATSTTVKGGSYRKALQAIDPTLVVQEFSCPLFVPLAEEGMAGDEVTKIMARRYLAPLQAQQIDTLVLGCTHYPLLREDIAEVMGPAVTLIESGEVLGDILSKQLPSSGAAPTAEPGKIEICVTDLTSHFQQLAEKIMAPRTVGSLERVVV